MNAFVDFPDWMNGNITIKWFLIHNRINEAKKEEEKFSYIHPSSELTIIRLSYSFMLKTYVYNNWFSI